MCVYYKFNLNIFLSTPTLLCIKVILFIILLIILRVGVPRYRSDHLSKIGWLKFSISILNVLAIFFLFMLFY